VFQEARLFSSIGQPATWLKDWKNDKSKQRPEKERAPARPVLARTHLT
jgi:hypothetical protein